MSINLEEETSYFSASLPGTRKQRPDGFLNLAYSFNGHEFEIMMRAFGRAAFLK